MKSKLTAKLYFKYAGFILIIVVGMGLYGYRPTQTTKDNIHTAKNVVPTKVKSPVRTMTPGAACCKVSFSRAGLIKQKINAQKKSK